MVEHGRAGLLETYGRFYGEQHFAIAFTAGTEGDDAKRVTARGWDKTAPLADGGYGASYIAGRGATKNPAIVLRPSNLIVLECDTEDDLLRIESLGLPDTVTVRSSKPYKRHYYFRPSPELESLPYVAFRFESGKLTADSGRYFLAPPSIHPSGTLYAFLPDHGPADLQIAVLPLETYRALTDQAQVEDDQLREAIESDPTARFKEGNRRGALFRYACMLRRWGLDRTEILAQTLRYNDLKCVPPVERHLVEVQVEGAMRKAGGQELARHHPLYLDEDPGPEYETPPEPQVDSWVPIDLNTLPAKPPIPPTLGGVGMVYPGKRHVFSGPQESAKTLAAYAIGIEIVRAGGTIILIDFEMGGYDARGRLNELGATPEEISRVRYLEPEKPADEERVLRLVALHPQLVIVDAAAGAYDLQGLDDNKRQDVGKISRLYVDRFWRAGIATIILDHVVKNAETRGAFAIGSERKVGGADVHLGFEVITPISRGTHGLYKIVTHKDRGGYLKRGTLGELELSSDPVTHSITWQIRPATPVDEEHPWMPTKVMQKVSGLLEKQTEPSSMNTLAAEVGGTRTVALTAIDHLCRLGYATESSGPRNSRLIHHTRSFTVYEWENQPDKSLVRTGTPLVRGTSPTTGSEPVSPYGGQEPVDAPENQTTGSAYSWVDELAPTEDAPADLFDALPDDIPF